MRMLKKTKWKDAGTENSLSLLRSSVYSFTNRMDYVDNRLSQLEEEVTNGSFFGTLWKGQTYKFLVYKDSKIPRQRQGTNFLIIYKRKFSNLGNVMSISTEGYIEY